MNTRKHGKPQSAAAPIDKVEFVNEIVDLLEMDDVDRHRAQRDIAERYGVSKGIVNKYYREANFAKAKNESMRNDSSGGVDFVPDGSDQALAVLFVQRCGETVRYIAKFGQWLTFDGVRWKVDEVGRVRELARKVCQEVAQRFLNGENGAALARSVASATKIDSVLRIVQADPQIAATHDQWDKDPLLLNTPGGVVDLRTREIRPSRPTDYLRKCTAVAPGWECNRWRDFLKRVTGNDPDTIAYLQRMAGYMLTGLTVEQAAFFAYGVGGNGKSKFLEAIAGLMGDYAVTAASSILMAKPFESHPTEIARLQNARLVISSEIGSGQRWNEAQLKLLTGGDRVTARYMRQDFFEFTPEFKLLIAANRKPQLSTVDEAIRRRLHLIPFDVAIPKAEQIGNLGEMLKREWPGILGWAIRGCIAWQKDGLHPPNSVRVATDEYFDSEDRISQWLDDCCECEPHAFTPIERLYSNLLTWAIRNGAPHLQRSEFSEVLSQRGFRKGRRAVGTGHHGLRLKPDDDVGAVVMRDERRRRRAS